MRSDSSNTSLEPHPFRSDYMAQGKWRDVESLVAGRNVGLVQRQLFEHLYFLILERPAMAEVVVVPKEPTLRFRLRLCEFLKTVGIRYLHRYISFSMAPASASLKREPTL